MTITLADYIKQPQPQQAKPKFGPPPIPMPPIIPTVTQNNVSPTPPKPRPDPIPLMLMTSGLEYIDRYEFHPQDSDLWIRLFHLADIEVGEPLASVLMYLRNTGAILVRSEQYGYRIEPVIGAEGWSSREEYEQERGMLAKHREKLLELLRRLAT